MPELDNKEGQEIRVLRRYCKQAAHCSNCYHSSRHQYNYSFLYSAFTEMNCYHVKCMKCGSFNYFHTQYYLLIIPDLLCSVNIPNM